MPDYIRTQSPWIGAADAMNQGAQPLMRLYAQLPQVRAQMQQHADQMAIQQGRLSLDQQEAQARIPVFNAQAANYNAGAAKDNAGAANLVHLLQLAQLAQNGATNLPQLAASSALLDSTSAARMRNDMTQPMTLNQGETAFTNPQLGTPSPLAQGVVSAPFGNTVLGGMGLPGTNAPVLQQGQFRPPGSSTLDPSTAALNLGRLAEIVDMLGGGEDQTNPLLQAAKSRAIGGQTNTPAMKSNIPQVGEIRQGYEFLGGDPAKQSNWRKK